jgi:hypothetical protein
VYIRSKRQVVCQIWNRLLITPDSSSEYREARVDLNHPDWDGVPAAEGAENSPSKSSQTSTPTKSWTLVDTEESPEKKPKLPLQKQDYDADPNNPLSLVIRKARSQSGKFMMHLLDTTGRAVGCGWKPAIGSWEHISPGEYQSSSQEYSQCSKCFRCHSIPNSPPQQTTITNKESDEVER